MSEKIYGIDNSKCKHPIYKQAEIDEIIKNLGETVLYDNTTGSTDTITLNETSANFKYLEVFFEDTNGIGGGYTKIYSPNGKTIVLSLITTNVNVTEIKKTSYTISGNTITPNSRTTGYHKLNSLEVSSWSSMENCLKITRIVGYK